MMQRIDSTAIDTIGIPRLLLMEHAGLAVAHAVAQLRDGVTPLRVLICAGTGFNGGDGLAAARHLLGWGADVQVVLAGRITHLRDEPAIYANLLQRLGVSITECGAVADVAALASRWIDRAIVVDALLGIGARGQVREPIHSMIAAINQLGRPIVAADVPSGLDADTGAVLGGAVRAAVTVTFGLAKQGLFRGAGPTCVGRLIIDPIGLPPALLQQAG